MIAYNLLLEALNVKYMTGTGFGPLTCIANMMGVLGRDMEDHDIARGMELPFLFAVDSSGYQAGIHLCSIERMNNYLMSLGLKLSEQKVAREQLPELLSSVRTASISLLLNKTARHSAVYAGMSGNRYRFLIAKKADQDVSDEVLLTKTMLLNRVDERVKTCIMSECEPTPYDPKPLLIDSLSVLVDYHNTLVKLWTRQIRRDEVKLVFRQYLRALIVDAPPIVLLAGDYDLSLRLYRLGRCYHAVHFSTLLQFSLISHVPWDMMFRCVMGLREITLDRLSELGLSNARIDKLMADTRKKLLPAPTMDGMPYLAD